jgi:carbamoyltransferase
MLYNDETIVYDANILGFETKLISIAHHMGHCAATYYTSNFDNAICFSMDSSGGHPDNNSFVAIGSNNKLFAQDIPGIMVGMAYADFTLYTGVGNPLYKAGSLMGLASYGQADKEIINNIDQYIKESYFPLIKSKKYKNSVGKDYFEYYLDLWKKLSKQDELFKTSSKKNKKQMNIAASIQYLFENTILDTVNNIKNNEIQNLCLSGGSMLNCNANTVIKKNGKFKNIHHFPACGDDGNSVGAALYVAHHVYDEPRYKYEYKDLMYLGKKYEYIEPNYNKIAKMISEGKIIAWFMGGSEFGPRALGARSILADPRNQHNRELLNFVVKNREWFRPFAPVVLEEESEKWFDFDGPSPFMLYTAQVLQPEKIPAVTHFDGSARMQTINKNTNEPYYNLVKEFFNITGIPMLINTSLNGKDQPILETPEDAINFLKNNDVDALVLNGELILKEDM